MVLTHCLFAASDPIHVAISHLPLIASPTKKDDVFKSLCKAVEENERLLAKGEAVFCEFYLYNCASDETVIFVSADFLLPYDTVATLNSISSAAQKIKGKDLVISSVTGVFVAKKPVNALEYLLNTEFFDDCQRDGVLVYEIAGREMYFLAGKRFSGTQRAFFMDLGMRFPLDTKVISSEYGMRVSPVYGRWKMHKGVDLAAPVGDSVYACKAGCVAFKAMGDEVFGNYLIISHEKGLSSVYAHLSKVLVDNGQAVSTGQVIGEVGQTGMATGPHLHFEVRRNGEAENPMNFLENGRK